MGRGSKLLGSSRSIGELVPCRFGAATAIAHIIESRGFSVSACLLGAGDIEFEMSRNKDFPRIEDGRPVGRPSLY